MPLCNTYILSDLKFKSNLFSRSRDRTDHINMIERSKFGWLGCILLLVLLAGGARADEDDIVQDTVEPDLGSSREGSRTDSEVA